MSSTKFKRRIIFIALLLLPLAAGIYFATNNALHPRIPAIDTSLWQDFHSPKMNVILKYPPDLRLTDQSNLAVNGEEQPAIIVSPGINLKDINYEGPRSWLGLVIDVRMPDHAYREDAYPNNTHKKLTSNQRILQTFEIDGRIYKLVDYGSAARFVSCKGDDVCVSAIERSDGTYISVTISTAGETTSSRHKIDYASNDYAILVTILKNLHFGSVD